MNSRAQWLWSLLPSPLRPALEATAGRWSGGSLPSLFGCTAGNQRRRVAFGLGRSRAAGPVGRTAVLRLRPAGRPVVAGGGALPGEEVDPAGCWGRRRWSAAADVVAAGGRGWVRDGELEPVYLGYPGGPEHVWPARAAGALRLLSARGRVCTYILTVCCSRGCGVLARGAWARPRWARL